METAICYLIINQIPSMPELAIKSMLENTSSKIFLGYLREEDLPPISNNDRIQKIKLELPERFNFTLSSLDYLPFDNTEFFRLVALKWQLFESIFEKGYDLVIYSDLDVMVFSDLVDDIEKSFKTFSDTDVLIQDASRYAHDPRLCMGLIAMRKSERVNLLIKDCYERHLLATQDGSRVGDDDIITQYYLSNQNRKWIMLLPQATYPVGQYLNLFSNWDLFPGLRPAKPIIFHSNYVIGRKNKILLMLRSSSLIDPKNYSFRKVHLFVILLKRIRLYLGTKKKSYWFHNTSN